MTVEIICKMFNEKIATSDSILDIPRRSQVMSTYLYSIHLYVIYVIYLYIIHYIFIYVYITY